MTKKEFQPHQEKFWKTEKRDNRLKKIPAQTMAQKIDFLLDNWENKKCSSK